MRVCAVVPIKTNNQRVPGKNTRLLDGMPLMYYAFLALKGSKLIDDIYVNSSDFVIREIAKNCGLKTINRPEWLNGADAQGNELNLYALDQISGYDIYVEHHATNPFITARTIDHCIGLINPPVVTSVIPVVEIFNRLWYKDKEVNHEYHKLIGTQFMDPVFEEAGLYVFDIPAFLKEESRITKNRKFVTISPEEAFDIDTELDFRMAEVLYGHLQQVSTG